MTPRVSICIPAYRQPAMLRRLLGSILEQDFVEFETIVTDDSPDDELERVVAEVGDRLAIRYERNSPPLGSPGNWNRSVERASTPYIKIMHHDDWFAGPGSLRAFVAMLDGHPQAMLAFGGSTHCDPAGRVYGHHRATPEQVDAVRHNPGALFNSNIIGAPSAVMFRRSAVSFDSKLKWLVDIDFYIRLLTSGENSTSIAWTADELVCVMGESAARVTADCLGNPAIELFEAARVYGRLSKIGAATRSEKRTMLAKLQEYGDPSAARLVGYGVDPDLAASLERDARKGKWTRGIRRSLAKMKMFLRTGSKI